MVANAADLERLALEDAPDIPALSGWRHELFGTAALELKRGALSLSYDGHRIVIRRT
jgi:ribonuclease D